MSNEKFTPGPWEVIHGEIRPSLRSVNGKVAVRGWSSGYAPLAKIVGDKRTTNPVINSANADLMAAAPELYEALFMCLDALRAYAPEYMHGMPLEKYVKTAAKALAKARGELNG